MVEGLLAGKAAAGHGQLKRLVHAGREAGLHFTIVNNLTVFSYDAMKCYSITVLFLYNIISTTFYLPKLE